MEGFPPPIPSSDLLLYIQFIHSYLVAVVVLFLLWWLLLLLYYYYQFWYTNDPADGWLDEGENHSIIIVHSSNNQKSIHT